MAYRTQALHCCAQMVNLRCSRSLGTRTTGTGCVDSGILLYMSCLLIREMAFLFFSLLRQFLELHTNKKDSQKLSSRAENEARTRDPNLGKVVLYQLSYFRICVSNSSSFAHPAKVENLISLGQGCALPTELFPHLFNKLCVC